MIRFAKAGRILISVVIIALLLTGGGLADTKGPKPPSKEHKCPVCGMFVYKYPDWVAEIIFKDGSVDFFDGAKDMFKYYFNLKKYNPQKTLKDIQSIYVTEWYGMELMETGKVHFVVGSDVYGPMGKELIPCATREDAEVFHKDHKGRLILKFEEVTPDVIRKLD